MLYLIMFIFIMFIALFIYMFFIEINNLKISRHCINKIDGTQSLKIVHLSDMHGKYRFFQGSLSEIVNREEPDFIVITGDILNKLSQLQYAMIELKKLKASSDIIFVKGNHETYESDIFNRVKEIDAEIILQTLENININVLVNQGKIYDFENKNIFIYGIDNSIENAVNIEKQNIEDLKLYDYSIILAHKPDSYYYLKNKNVVADAYLAGHTHGGQINIPFLFDFAEKFLHHKGFISGYFEDKDGKIMSISRGLGNTNVQARFLNRPEIIIYEILI